MVHALYLKQKKGEREGERKRERAMMMILFISYLLTVHPAVT